jgi:hypothetical protein
VRRQHAPASRRAHVQPAIHAVVIVTTATTTGDEDSARHMVGG